MNLGSRVRLIRDKCPDHFYSRQSKGHDGVVTEVRDAYCYVLWDNGHRNSYYYNQIELLIKTNREAIWILKR